MKPLMLKFSAFGPYLNQQVLDFTELKNNSFFLIHGATGAGKSTILDAMCYALYGDSSGNLRDGKNMRTNQADINVATAVEFCFMIGAKTYTVFRNPEQERPKKRGDGTTLQPADATLYEKINTEEKLLTTGYSNVTMKIEELLGFKSNQFRQVVLLPQGEFRKLLLANSLERQEIMQTLFKTDLYKKIEETLKEKAKAKEQNIKTLIDKNNFILQELDSNDLQEVQEKITQLAQEITAGESNNKELLLQKNNQQKLLSEATVIKEYFNNLQAAIAEQSAVSLLEPKVEEYRIVFNKAQQANSLVDFENQLVKLEVELRTVTANITKEEQKLDLITENLGKSQKELKLAQDQEPELKELAKKLLYLEDMQKKLKEITTLSQGLALKQKLYQTAVSEKKILEDEILGTQEKLQELKGKIEQLQELASQIQLQQQNLLHNKKLVEKLKLLEEQQLQVEQKKQNLVTVQEIYNNVANEYQAENTKVLLLRENFRLCQAALLAQTIKENKPCPVCGSLNHPQLATSAVVVEASVLEAAEQKLQVLEQARIKQQQQLYDVKTAHDVLIKSQEVLIEELSDNKFSLEELLVKEQCLQRAYRDAKQAEQQLLEEKKEYAKLEQVLLKNNESLVKISNIWQERKTAFEQAQAIISEKEQSLGADYQDQEMILKEQRHCENKELQIKQALNKYQAEVEQYQQQQTKSRATLESLREFLQTLTQKYQRENLEFTERLLQLGFKDQQEYLAAKKEPSFCAELAQRLKNFDERAIAAKDNLKKWTELTKTVREPDLSIIKEKLSALETAYNVAFSELEQRKLGQQKLQQKAQELLLLQQEIMKGNNDYGIVGKLAEIANGKNNYGLTFQRFVLRALLEDVIVASNIRLKIMTRGQYTLQGTSERERKNSAGGLEIEVFDNYTGYARPVGTLSGGEGFLASLALALGLADVVQAYAGGIHLDTILIDEGFGTLDPEALDIAIKALIDLQRGGRLVGIISHVPELKERINARLEVVKTKQGSKASFKVG